MKEEKGKWLFLTILVIILILLCSNDKAFFCPNKKSVDENIEVNGFNVKNTGDIYYINGEGALDATTLTELLHKNNILTTDIVHLIIGDNIKEIGYNCLATRFPYLETIKLGREIEIIRNGAVLNCPLLSWIYIPKSVCSIGKDFLRKCPDVKIVLEGDRSVLENLTLDVDVYEQIDSLEALKANYSRKPYQVFTSEMLHTTGSFEQSCITLNPGNIQFGPYTSLERGKYDIEVYGNSFDTLNRESIYINTNAYFSVNAEHVVISESMIHYLIDLPDDVYRMELGITNTNLEKTITVYELYIFKNSDYRALPDMLAKWWE